MYKRNPQPTGITRGDDKTFVVSVAQKPFTSGDSVTMTVRQRAGQGEALITKTVTTFYDGKAVIDFVPADTEELAFGTYSYDVEATYQDVGVKTVITPSDFVIGQEDTY